MTVKEDQRCSFAFKAHREENDCYPVSMITFAPNNILVTGSPDGSMVMWDKDQRKKLCKLPEAINSQKTMGADIVDADFCRFTGGLM